MPTHGSLTKAGKVRDQSRKHSPDYGRSWSKDRKKRKGPRMRNRRKYKRYMSGKTHHASKGR